MSARWLWRALLLASLGGLLVAGVMSPKTRFIVGGALVSLGLRIQDHLEPYDFVHPDAQERPVDVWREFLAQNELSSRIRQWFPRTPEKPLVAMVVCMDARLDVNELTGDTRGYYYVIRTAGSVLGAAEQEMLELAVEKGVKLVVLTRHTDCAAEKTAHDHDGQAHFPALTAEVLEHDRRVQEFLARPAIAKRIAAGTLLVKEVVIDTDTERLVAGAEP